MSLRKYTSWYTEILNRRPLRTKIITFGILAFAGDVTCQKLEQWTARSNSEKVKDYSFTRSLRLSSCYAFLCAPTVHFYYSLVIFRLWPKETIPNVLKAVAFDNTIVSGQNLTLFLIYMNSTAGKTMEEIKQIFRENYFKTLLKYLYFWIPVGLVNFRYVPNHYRAIVVSVASFIWTIVLSFIQSGIEKKNLQLKEQQGIKKL